MSARIEPPAPARSPWQRLYAAVLIRRRLRARRRARRLPRPAVSVGNLHWGGAGKTPLVRAVAARLAARGARVAVLSRGYRRRGRQPLLVSAGAGPLVDWREAGDEPYWLAQRLADVVVAVDADRTRSAELALRAAAVDLFVLDDAFSHVRVARDLDLLAFPALDPFAGGRLLPSGRLREPLGAARFADAVLLTGLPAREASLGAELASALRTFGFEGPGFGVAENGYLTGEASGPDAPAGGRGVVLVTGVARPERVAATARRLGLVLREHLAFPDHHEYPERSLARVRRAAQRHDAPVVTTAKDAMKLRGRLAREPLVLELLAEPEPAFFAWLEARVDALLRDERVDRGDGVRASGPKGGSARSDGG
jgi:tetraacyldisaccharide 4'-kinase